MKEDLAAWEINAEFWDICMGDESNQFHQEVVRPGVSQLLKVKEGDYILDIACGNGNYSAYIAEHGGEVVAFDYSPKMIDLARKRQQKQQHKIEFCVVDATSREDLLHLKRERKYNKAVSNMAIMDIEDVSVLFKCVNELLEDNGIFVFATQHPCFVTLTDQYLSAHHYTGDAIEGQPVSQFYYHRSLQEIFNLCFQNGFVIDGFCEKGIGMNEKPDVVIIRVKKQQQA
jgi:2-polyprenyl-3-methyl-5-hydroxy-6-metoxy-1,4-benzoquinol methylase